MLGALHSHSNDAFLELTKNFGRETALPLHFVAREIEYVDLYRPNSNRLPMYRICLYSCLSVCVRLYVSTCLSHICLSPLSASLSVCPSIYLFIKSVCPSSI